MSIHKFVSGYSGAFPDRLRQLLVANTTGTSSSWTINDLWMKFLTERGYTSGSLDDRLRRFLLAYTGASSGTTSDLWRLVTGPFVSGSLLLDLYPNSVLAFSTGRKLRTAYSGPLFRVRRSSDNAEQDIGFVEGTGIVDVAALTTFVGANSGFVVTEYNQSLGGGLDATIGTASLQPTIVLAGVVQTLGTSGLPAPLWVAPASASGDDRLSVTNLTLSGTELVAYWACRDTDHTYYRAICHYGSGSVSSGEFAIYSPDIDFGVDNATFFNNSGSTPNSAAVGAAPADYVGRVRGNLLSGSTLEAIRVNKGAETAGTTTSAANYGAAKNFHLGNRSDGVAGYAGVLGEFILYSNLSVAVTDGVEDNIAAFWGIT